jgi:ribonuclease E
MVNYSTNINKQKGDKKSRHKSYQGISKPQQNIAENGLSSAKEAAAIDTNHLP